MKTLFAPDEAPVPTFGGGGGGSLPSQHTSSVIDTIQCEFHDYPRAAVVDAMESCLLDLEGEVKPETLKECMRRRLRGNDLPAAAGAH
ncbi:MAG: hypothetical protein EOP86_00995 [Verrucomicrobiaceae bacterium]|nr:MAG: hypothetical protein EOP86_00995 [Verrucomicrobiaceae bacterium]